MTTPWRGQMLAKGKPKSTPNTRAADKVANKPSPPDIYHGLAHAKMVGTPVWKQTLPMKPPGRSA